MAKKPTVDLYILSGERSGEAYAVEVLKHLRNRFPELRCVAMGHTALKDVGAEIEYSYEGYDVVGFIPILLQLRKFLKRRADLVSSIQRHQPKVVLSIDYPGMNMDVQERLTDLQDSCRMHVVAPQVWAWRPWRAKKYAHACDRLACFFPFEPQYFTPFGCQADFIGHPMVDIIAAEDLAADAPSLSVLDPQKKLLLLAPGSRRKEVLGLLPIYNAAALRLQRLLAARGEDIQVVISQSQSLPESLYRTMTQFPLIKGNYRQLCHRAHVAAIASGTASLEASLIQAAHVVCYKTDPATASIAFRLATTEHVSLANIIHGRRVLPELLQKELTAERLVLRLLGLWAGKRRENCLSALSQVAEKLGGTGAMRKLADLVGDEIEKRTK